MKVDASLIELFKLVLRVQNETDYNIAFELFNKNRLWLKLEKKE